MSIGKYSLVTIKQTYALKIILKNTFVNLLNFSVFELFEIKIYLMSIVRAIKLEFFFVID